MTTEPLHGVVPPVVTPLNDDRSLDLSSYEQQLERLIQAGVDGLFVLGSTGEVAFATDDQRRTLIETAVAVVAGRVPVIAGVVDTQTSRVLSHIEVAAKAGADAVVATAPFYAMVTQQEVRKHFALLGKASALPVYAYDIPVCVHSKLDGDMLVELGGEGLIAGVKDSSGDDVSFRKLVIANADAGRPLTILTGHEVVVDGAYLSGADGVVPGLGNVDPAAYVRLHRAAQAQDWETVRSEQDRLARLMDIARVARDVGGWGVGVGGFKTALMLLNVIASNQVPDPFDALAGKDIEAVREVLIGSGLLS